MHCSDCVELIARMLDGSLPDHRVQDLNGHLSSCSRCQAELCFQKKIREALATEVSSGLSTDFTWHVSQEAFRMTQREKRTRMVANLVPAFASAATIAVLFLLGPYLIRVFPSHVEPLADALSKSISWAGNTFLGVLSFLASLVGEQISLVEAIPQPAITSVLAMLLASIPIIWSFYRVSAFLRE